MDRNLYAPRHTTGSPWPAPPYAVDAGRPQIPHWVDTEKPIQFVVPPFTGVYADAKFGDTTNVAARAILSTPQLNLRPDLSENYRPQAVAVPGAARLHCQIRNTAGTFLTALASSLEVYSLEQAAIVDPDQLRAVEERFDITTDFYAGTESTLLEWAPPGAPVMFWQVFMVFDWMDAIEPAPNTLVAWMSVH